MWQIPNVFLTRAALEHTAKRRTTNTMNSNRILKPNNMQLNDS